MKSCPTEKILPSAQLTILAIVVLVKSCEGRGLRHDGDAQERQPRIISVASAS